MKKILMALMLTSSLSLPAFAGVTLNMPSGSNGESHRSVESHGIDFQCLVLEKGETKWMIHPDQIDLSKHLLKAARRLVQPAVEKQMNQNRNYCAQFEAMKSKSLAEERAILNLLAENLAARLVVASGTMGLEEMARSSRKDLATCVNDLINVEQLNQIERNCL